MYIEPLVYSGIGGTPPYRLHDFPHTLIWPIRSHVRTTLLSIYQQSINQSLFATSCSVKAKLAGRRLPNVLPTRSRHFIDLANYFSTSKIHLSLPYLKYWLHRDLYTEFIVS